MVTIQQCPNHIACGTFEEGGEAAKLDFEEQGSIQICGVECQVISPAPRWRRFSCIITPTRTMTVQCIGFCCPTVAFLVPSRVSPQVVGPLPLRLIVLSRFLWEVLLCRGDVSPCPSLLSGQWALALLLSPGWICFTIGCNPV